MRKKQSKKRALIPDPKFNDQLVTRFVNNLMLQGKKSTAYKVFYDAIDIVESKKGDEEKSSLELWKDALSNVMPHVERKDETCETKCNITFVDDGHYRHHAHHRFQRILSLSISAKRYNS